MPRQLPWASKAGTSRTQVKASPRPAKKSRVASDVDDEFFDGTILAGNKKGKERAVNPDDDLSDLAAESKTPRTNFLNRGPRSADRAPSSSPPPIADFEEPIIEPMRKGFSKFDLRDDEWMMVEDEFLETAKLFTRHLHIAEYERLKETIEAKKKEAEIARPVVPNAKLSFEGTLKEKAKVQEKKQREAIRDVFASQSEDGDSSLITRPSFDRLVNANLMSDSDGEDLDAMKPLPRHALLSKPVPAPTTRRPITGVQPTTSTSRPISTSMLTSTATTGSKHTPSTASTVSFRKPPLPPPTTKPRARPARATPFDMLDDYVPKKAPVTPKSEARLLPGPETPARVSFSESSTSARTPASTRTTRSTETNNGGLKTPVNGTSKDVTDRFAKRKAEKEKEDKEKQKRKAVKLDDIPTFLF